jgi:hypothetical protein
MTLAAQRLFTISPVPDKLPSFVIIGAQKAASTSLARALADHPALWLPRDEVPLFRDPLYGPDTVQRLAELSRVSGDRHVGIKCPDYLARPEVPSRLYRDLDEPRLIVTLRSPVQRAISAYYWRMRWGLLPIAPPEVGLIKILQGGYRDLDRTAGEVLEWGLYHEHLSRYLAVFADHRLFITLDEDLADRPAESLTSLYDFLGVTADLGSSLTLPRDNSGVYSLSRLRFLNRRNRFVLRWNDARDFASIDPPSALPQRLASAAVAAGDRYVLSHVYGNERPVLSHELMAALSDYYEDDIRKLERLLNRSLDHWLYPRAAEAEG